MKKNKDRLSCKIANVSNNTFVENESDWNYFLSHCDSKEHPIPLYFDKENWKINETYRIRISHVYSPSKFWIVTKEKELDLFQSYLYDFYSKNQEHYKIPIDNKKLNMYCVAYTDGAYYRGILVNNPHPTSCKINYDYVFLFDFGFMATVPTNNLFFLPRKMYTVPHFAVRASLTATGPIQSQRWTETVVNRFHSLVSGKILLCNVAHIDNVGKVLYINVGDYDDDKKMLTNIKDVLIQEKIARHITDINVMNATPENENSRYESKVRFPFLFPTFKEIEEMKVPPSVLVSELLQQCVANDVLYKNYYSHRNG